MTEPGFRIHTSNRLEILVEHLARRLAVEPLDPLEPEVIVVPSRGIRRWLTLELARRLGIAASLSMPFPGTFCRGLAARFEDEDADVAPEAGGRGRSPFGKGGVGGGFSAGGGSEDRELLVWRLYAALPAVSGDPAGGAAGGATASGGPAAYLEDDPDRRKRYQLASRLAELFERYELLRPDLLRVWEAGGVREDGVAPAAGDPAVWQAELWRRLVGAAGEDSLPRRLERLRERLRRAVTDPALRRRLPRRVQVFGAGTLPPVVLEVLTALARSVPVRLYLPSPTYHYWGDLRSDRETTRLRRRLPAPDDQHLERGHPLLASLGRQGRDFFNLLQAADDEGAAWHELDFVDPGTDTLLHAVQSDVLHLVDRGAGEPPLMIDRADRSLRVHVCHSPMREMEVVRDLLLDAFARDPTLAPSDVAVMVPEIADYSPYVDAVFGVDRAGTPRLPYSIADRRRGEEQPPAETVLTLLALVRSRLAPNALFDLLDVPAIRRAGGLRAAEIPALRRMVRATNVRWGIDGAQRRADFDLPPEDANTWRAGLDRLLMGVAAGGGEELVAGILPHAGATASAAELLGRFAGFVETLFHHLETLRAPRPLDAWAAALGAAVDALYAPEGEDEERALELVREALDGLVAGRELAGVDEPVPLEAVRASLAERLGGETLGGGFLDGRITFCSLKPMRAIPFRVVCLAGLDDGVFPRRDPAAGFDLVARHPRPGDRRRQEDDRYLFFETLLAAGERLILTYRGRSQKDHRRRAPSVLLSELLDHLDRAFVTGEAGVAPSERVTVVERLHPWSAAYYRRGEDRDDPGRGDRLFTYSRENLPAVGERSDPPPFLPAAETAPEPADAGAELELDLVDLAEFWVHPARAFCRRTLELRFDRAERELEEAEPFAVDFLERYRISQWLLERRLDRRADPDAELALLRARGALPLAGLGRAAHARLDREVEELAATLPRARPHEPLLVELAGPGWRLHGRLDELTDAGLLRFRAAKLKPKDRLRAWVAHLVWNAWAAARGPAELPPLVTHVVGRDRALRLPAIGGPDAIELLDALVAGYREGLERPLPVFEKASYAYAEKGHHLRTGGRSKLAPEDAARRAWEGGERFPGDRADPYVALVFRDREPLSEAEFARRAETLWRPFLERAEELES